MRRFWLAVGFVAGLLPMAAEAQFTPDFAPQEFAARRAKVMDAIGDGIAVIQGSAETPGYEVFKQNAQFFYLTGVLTPRALLVIDGKARKSTLILPAGNARRGSSETDLFADDKARAITGVEEVASRDTAVDLIAHLAGEGRPLYAPFRYEARLGGATEHSTDFDSATMRDPFDGRKSREQILVDKLKAASGRDVKNLDPILDKLRMIKSPAEIAALREASRIAQMGIMETMRSVKPGMYEYELAAVADYEFLRHGASGPSYPPIVAAGKNIMQGHYNAGTTKLGPTDMVLMDDAPDYHYYQSDMTRMFPASGKFLPRQREIYTIYLRLYQAIITSIKPHVTPLQVIGEAAAKMDKVMTTFPFTDPKIKNAADKFVDDYRKASTRDPKSWRGPTGFDLTNLGPMFILMGHMIGLEGHDAAVPFDTFEPGMLFTVEPALRIPDEQVNIRLEDIFLITPTGYDNLTGIVPEEPDAIEKLMRERGLGKRTVEEPRLKAH